MGASFSAGMMISSCRSSMMSVATVDFDFSFDFGFGFGANPVADPGRGAGPAADPGRGPAVGGTGETGLSVGSVYGNTSQFDRNQAYSANRTFEGRFLYSKRSSSSRASSLNASYRNCSRRRQLFGRSLNLCGKRHDFCMAALLKCDGMRHKCNFEQAFFSEQPFLRHGPQRLS